MKKIFLILCFLVPEVLSAQSGFYVDKDKRIKNVQTDIVQFLIEQKQIYKEEEITSSKYLNRIFVVRQLEFYSRCDNVLLIHFGALAEHGNSYWGIVKRNEKKDTLSILNKNERVTIHTLSTVLNTCDTATLKSILYFIEESEKRDLIIY